MYIPDRLSQLRSKYFNGNLAAGDILKCLFINLIYFIDLISFCFVPVCGNGVPFRWDFHHPDSPVPEKE